MLHFNLTTVDLFTIWIIWFLTILIIAIGLEKIVKIIIWNYLLIVISIWLNIWIDILIFFIDQNIIHLSSPDKIINNLLNLKSILIIFIYFILLVLIFYKSNLGITFDINKFFKFLLTLFFAPLAIISILTSLSIAVLWTKLLNSKWIIELATQFKNNIIVYYLILLFPLWLILPGLITIVASTNISLPKIKLNFNLKRKKQETNEEEKNE